MKLHQTGSHHSSIPCWSQINERTKAVAFFLGFGGRTKLWHGWKANKSHK